MVSYLIFSLFSLFRFLFFFSFDVHFKNIQSWTVEQACLSY